MLKKITSLISFYEICSFNMHLHMPRRSIDKVLRQCAVYLTSAATSRQAVKLSQR